MRHFAQIAALAMASSAVAVVLPRDGPPMGGPGGPPMGGPGGPPMGGPPKTTPAPTAVWGEAPAACKPTYEAYTCDDEDGEGEYKTTFTLYPSGCPLYTKEPWNVKGGPKSWYNVPAKASDPWAPASWKPTPTPDPWAPVSDPWTTWGMSKEDYEWWVAQGKDGWPGKPGKPWVPPMNGKPGMPPKPAVPSGWGDWNKWVSPKPTDPAKWNEWDPYVKGVDGKTVVIITKTETYYVPCATGWATSTSVWYTEHCGCTATPVPVSPIYVTLTTVCPTTWGLGATVVYSTPSCSYTPAAATPVAVVSTWVATPVAVVSTWVATPVAAASTWVATPVAAASTWVATPVAAATNTWVAVYKGAASSNALSSVMIVGAGAVAGLAYLL